MSMTMRRLDSKYFKHVKQERLHGLVYDAYHPLDQPIVLMSLSTGKPLASLHLRVRDHTRRDTFYGGSYTREENNEASNRPNVQDTGRALIVKRPDGINDDCDFQGVFTKDNQEFELVITNLCPEGLINFNILKVNQTVREVNPGGLNEINELRPGESYAVQCDQVDNRSLIFQTLKSSDGSQVTVQQDEDQAKVAGNKKKGTYYYLSVVGQYGKDQLKESFKETRWMSMDIITIERDISTEPNMGTFPRFMDTNSRGSRDPYYYDLFVMNPQRDHIHVTRQLHGGLNERKLKCVGRPKATEYNQSILRDTIMDSKAGQVVAGRQMYVRSSETGLQYEYEYPSAPCVVGLSMSETIKFTELPSDDILQTLASEQFDLLQKEVKEKLLEELKKVYKSEECCICMEVNPDTVIYQCGHQCLHNECMVTDLHKCPLCRKLIAGSLQVNHSTTEKNTKTLVDNTTSLSQPITVE